MPIVNPAHQFLKYPRSQVGNYALDLASLAANNIPLPLTFCVPISALQTIANHNNLQIKFKKIRNKLNLQSTAELDQAVNKVQQLIKHQTFPKQVSQALLKLYTEKLDKDFIRLTASPADGKKLDYKREDNIKGEANMMESILNLWARNIDPTDVRDDNLFPVAIVIQAQTQPKSSGLAYSLNINNGDKSKISILSVFGVYQAPKSEAVQDSFVIDQRNWQISTQTKAQQTHYLVRQPDKLELKSAPELADRLSISTAQAIELAHLVRKIKLRRTDQIKLHWELVNDQLIITKIKPYHFLYNNLVDKNKYQTILIGHGVTTGFISGRCALITNETDLRQIKPGMIAVVKNLTKNHRGLIQICQAVICEKNIVDNELLNQIRHYHLPCIVNAQGALKQLRNNQLITLDVSGGKVYQQKTQGRLNQELKQTTQPQVYLAVNQFQEVNEQLATLSSGIGVLRSEQLFIETGLHPKKILSTQADQLKEKVVKEAVNFFHRFINLKQQEPLIIYRSNNLDTNHMAKLDGGEVHEIVETNPLLGFRGGLRILNQKEWFKFELELIQKINSKLDRSVNLMLPFVRSSFELQQLYLMIEEISQSALKIPPVWLQLNTPENLFNIKEYLNIPLAGISINLKTIHALLHGIDPGFDDVYNQYSFNAELFLPALKQAVQDIKQNNTALGIHFILSDYHQELLSLAHELQIEGVVVPPKLALQTKKYLIDRLRN